MSVGADSIEVTQAPEWLGPYLLLERIGAGGMAEGWRAVKFVGDARHKVFLKRILSEHRSDPDYVSWFLREAAIVASLRHANIVGLIEFDREGRYLVFELIDGLDLRHLLRSHPDRRLPVDFSVLILTEVLKGLEHAHARTSGGAPAGVIHRDLDPSNVLISYAGEVKIADFGVAAFARGDGEPHTHIVGKKGYQAPEETRNEGGLDGRSDLFSLGVVGYQMLTGERPYTGSRAEIVRAIAAGRRVPLQRLAPEVPAALAEIIERLLSPDPAARFASAPECQHAIYAAYAPDQMLYRELGQAAVRARPHHTIETSRLRSLASRAPLVPSTQEVLSAQEVTTRVRLAVEEVATVPNSDAIPAAASGSEQLVVPDPADPPTVRAVVLVEDGATAARRARRRVRGYVALSIALVSVGLIVTAARSPDSADPRRRPTRAAEAKALAAELPPSPPAPPPVQPPAAATSAPQAAQSASAETTAPTAPKPTPVPTPTGTLRIGAVPQSQVWIDRRLVGWSPIIGLQVQAGQHTVSIGRDGREDASTRREVTVTPGHQQRVGF